MSRAHEQTHQQAAAPAPLQLVSTSLYVGDLEPNVAESQLYEIFSQVGQVFSIRVCRDVITRLSLGYAYVNYNSAQDATRALELLNFTPVNEKPIRVMFSHCNPSVRNLSGTANIFIKNLDKSIDSKALFDTFSAFGPILSCKVATDDDGSGQSKGYGFVQFEQDESAQSAIENVNGMLLKDKKVFVGPFVSRRERRDQSGGVVFTNVYVKNIAKTTTDEELRNRFAPFGAISSAVVMRDSEGKSKCFGFVNFEHTDDAAKAVETLNGKKIDDEKEWYVGRAQKKSEREAELRAKFEQDRKHQGTNLYVKHLDDTIDDEKLRELFVEFGAITSCTVMLDPQGRSRGWGFVAFSTPSQANSAVANMHNKMAGRKPLYVALAQRKEERRARFQAYWAAEEIAPLPISEAQLAQIMRTPGGVGPVGPTCVPLYHPGDPAIGQQIFYGQPPPCLISPQFVGFSYDQQPMHAGIRPRGGRIPNFDVPVVQRQNQQCGQSAKGRRRGEAPQHQQRQQMLPRGRNHSFPYTPKATLPPQVMGGMPYVACMELNAIPSGGGVDADVPQPVPFGALASALASAPPELQREMLGEQLYALVAKLTHDKARKVTGMLLEMDQTEVLHLIESPEALMAKVLEAMEVLRMTRAAAASAATDQLAGLILN